MDVTQVLWPDSSPFAQYLASQGRDDVLETFAAVSTSAPGGSAAVPKDSRLGKYCTTAIAPETCALINPWLERCLVLTAPKSSSSDATRVDDSATLSVSAGVLVRLCVSALLLAIAVYSAVASSDRAWHAQLDSVALCGFTLISSAVLAAYLNLCWVRWCTNSLCVWNPRQSQICLSCSFGFRHVSAFRLNSAPISCSNHVGQMCANRRGERSANASRARLVVSI